MKSKEAIRNKVIRYTNLVWNGDRINNLNPLVHLIIEETCNELFLLDNRLTDIDSTILEKLVNKLSPTGFNYVRPAHGLLFIKPETAQYRLTQESEFFMKNIPDNLREQIIVPPVFTPVTDITLINTSIKHLFFDRTLWSTDDTGEKKVVLHTQNKADYNTLWMQLEYHSDIKRIQDLCLYLDFPHLNDNDDYYEVLSDIKWNCNGKKLQVEQGIPFDSGKVISPIEYDILNYYKKHYWTISDVLHPEDVSTILPPELQNVIDEEAASSIPTGIWLSIKFPSHFRQEDITKVFIVINTFPVVNRRNNEHRVSLDDFSGIMALPSEPGEEFLEIEFVKDSSQNMYNRDDILTTTKKGIYSVEPVRKKDLHDSRIYDYLERFIDTFRSERSVFPNIDEDRIQSVLNSISDILGKENHKQSLNNLNDYAEVARLAINPHLDSASIETKYWTSLAGRLNGLPKGTAMMANKIPALNKSDAVLLTKVDGGRAFYDLESLKAINRFFLVSKGKIVTKFNIVSFCEIEVGKYCNHIDVVRKAKISPGYKEGIINVMEVRLTPKEQYIEYFNQKGVLGDLKIRLSKYSPPHYRYVIKIMEDIKNPDIRNNRPLSLTERINKN